MAELLLYLRIYVSFVSRAYSSGQISNHKPGVITVMIITEQLIYTRHSVICRMHNVVIVLTTSNNSMGQRLLFPFFRKENWNLFLAPQPMSSQQVMVSRMQIFLTLQSIFFVIVPGIQYNKQNRIQDYGVWNTVWVRNKASLNKII